MDDNSLNIMETAVLHASIHAKNVNFFLFGHGYSYRKVSYYELEYNLAVQPKITDLDMLLFRIDKALELEDKDMFVLLTEQLKEV